MLVALVAGLVMVTVPLYLWRRPSAEAASDPSRASPATSISALSALATTPSAAFGAAPPPANGKSLGLADAKLLKCSKPGEKASPERCDRQPFFEESLVKAIRENAACAPAVAAGGTINFVLDIDYQKKKLRTWAGKSGSIKRKAAREVLACVNRALGTPDWSQIQHTYTKYQVAVLATYPPTGSNGGI